MISYVEKVIESSGNDPIELDYLCPKCQEELFLTETETFLYCGNENCPGVKLGKIEKFCVSTGMKGVRYKTLEKLFNEDVISDISSLYENREELLEKIQNVESFHERSIAKFITTIDSIKEGIYDYIILGSLGIEGVGKSRFKDICAKYTIDELADSYEDDELVNDIKAMKGFSEILAKRIDENFMDVYTMYDTLKEHIKVKEYKDDVVVLDQPEVFVITGNITGLGRSEVKQMLEAKGHKVTGSVTKNTTYLVTNDPSSGTVKIKKAIELGVPVIDETVLFSKFLNS